MQAKNLRICLLGGFSLCHDKPVGNEPGQGVYTARLQALLAYLVLHRHTPQSRQHLAFLFWPDTNEAQALTNLRNLLHKLRQALPTLDDFLETNAQTVQWRADAPFTLDVADFEDSLTQTASRENLARAVQLYRGDLLPSCYDDWILPEREQLRQLFLDALEQLVSTLEAKRDYRAAIHYGQRLLQIDPYNEGAYRTLMRLHAANHDRAGALAVYQQCVEILQKEFEAEPEEATQTLYQRLHRSAPEPPRIPQDLLDQPPLVGRGHEWQTLLDSWRNASHSQPHCLLLSGEAGIGKTRLADELVVWVQSQGFATATAHCYASEGALAYAPVAAWLRTNAVRKRLAVLDPVWLTEVARLLPELLTEHPQLPVPGQLTAGWQRQRFFEALARSFLTAHEPLLLFMDDLQWCDRDTLEWLHYLLRFAQEKVATGRGQGGLLLVGTLRSDEINHSQPLMNLLLALRRASQITELVLGPLDASETTSLANAIAKQTLTTEQTDALYQQTEGNPLFIVEMMRTGGWGLETGNQRLETGDRRLEIRDQRSETGNRGATRNLWSPVSGLHAPLPPKVNAVIQARLAQLSAPTRELAGLAATIGRAFPFAVLAQASNQDEATLVQGLDELCQRQIVRERSANTYDFTHDKLREATYNSMSAARRRMLHKWVAQALEMVYGSKNGAGQNLDAVSGQVATHYELAGDFDKAIHYYQQAAEAAHRVYANADAIRTYQRALALVEGPAGEQPSGSVALYERLGDLLVATGQYEEAQAVFSQAVTKAPDEVTRARLHRKIGNTWREQYQYPNAVQCYAVAMYALEHPTVQEPAIVLQTTFSTYELEANLKRPGEQHPPAWWEEWIQVHLELDFVHYWLAETGASAALQARLQPLVEWYGAPSQRANFFQRKSMLELRRNRSIATDEAVRCAQRSLTIYAEANMQDSLPSAHFMLGFMHLWHGDLAQAVDHLQTALQSAEQSGDISLQARALTYLSIAHRQRGEVEATQQRVTRVLAVATTAHMPEYVALASANEAWLAWRAGDDAAVSAQGCAALTLWQQLPATHASLPFQWTALWPLLASALKTAEVETAIRYTRTLLDPRQQQLPEAIVLPLEHALQMWDNGAPAEALQRLKQGLEVAQQLHYL
ncbi:MAG: AAA family ATPase [Caldilineaceae bacterium]